MQEVMQCLKKYGQRLDLEIAAEMRVPLATVRKRLAELSAAGDVVMRHLTRYEGTKTIEAWPTTRHAEGSASRVSSLDHRGSAKWS